MPSQTIASGAEMKIDGAESVKLKNEGTKPADIEITGDGMHANRRIEAGDEITERLFGNPATITNKSKYDVTASW